MAELNIDLRYGFNNETVTIFIDGQKIYAQKGVSTKYRMGLADSFLFKSSKKLIRIRIVLPERSSSAGLDLDIEKTPYLGISLDDQKKIQLQLSIQPIGKFRILSDDYVSNQCPK